MPSATPTEVDEEEEDVNILSKNLVATQNTVGWNGQPARAIDGNTDGQWRSGYVTAILFTVTDVTMLLTLVYVYDGELLT